MTSSGGGADVVRVATGLQPVRSFDVACELVLEHLCRAAPMGMWAVTRIVSDRQTMLRVRASSYDIGVGTQFSFGESMCRPMATGEAPQIAPDVSTVPVYAAVAAVYSGRGLPVGAYVGAPIVQADGELFGTVCGFSPDSEPESLLQVEPLLGVFSSLLSAVLDADTTAVKAAREVENARREADVDPLTGLLNRRGWDRYLRQEELRYQRFGDPASIVMLDLDRLKEVNDRYGHAAGDQHIQAAARVLRAVTRASDVLARLGGDEFAVLAVGSDPEHAAILVSRLEQALEKEGVAGSAGYAPYTIVAGFPGALSAADQAMYQRKHERRQRLRREPVPE